MGSVTMSGLLARPWRRFKEKDPWTEDVYTALKGEIVTHEHLDQNNLEFINVLLIGQISSGKSAFYNTVESVFTDYVTNTAGTGARERSLTTQFRTYKVKAKDQQKKPISFRFCDTMGLSATSGIKSADYGKIMDGHVQDGADLRGKLVPGVAGYNQTPGKEDEMHCVAFIVDASRFEFIDEGIVDKFAEIRDEADSRNLNPVVILTRVDLTCNELDRDDGDIRHVFQSKTIKEMVADVSARLGVSEGLIFPVQNYSIENEKEVGVDILCLRALRQILRNSETYLDDLDERQDEELKQALEKVTILGGGRGPNVQPNSRAPPSSARNVNRAPPPPTSTSCTAIYARKRDSADQLDMSKGQQFQVLKENQDGGWTLVQNSAGSTGLVPTDWIKID